MADLYRILALDGGGLRGIFTAAVLAECEDAFGSTFLGSFDLLVGTSTGGIIALGLASGHSCREMLDFYRDVGPTIFGRGRRLRRLVGPKYDRRALDELLQQEFGPATRMNELGKAVCITAHELVGGTTRVWKDDHSPELRVGGDQLVWKVAAATSAAPTFFAPVQLGDADSHIDGGIWSNNPAMVGVVEAIRYANRQLSEIRLLSVGTTSQPLRVASHRKAVRMGFPQWMREALHLIQDSASMATDHQVRFLLGEDAYLRLNSERASRIKLDDAAQCRPLQEWGHDVGRKNIAAIARVLEIPR